MKRLKLFVGEGNTQKELDDLEKLVREKIELGERDTPGFTVHDFKIATSNEVRGSLDGTEGSVRSTTTVIIGVVYERTEGE